MHIIKKSLYLCLASLFLSSPAIAALTIEKGDLLQVYILDAQGTDIVLGLVKQGTSGIDPHQVTVSSEGRVYIPNVGVFSAAGKTPNQLERGIRKKISRTIKVSEVAVLIANPKYTRVYLLGEVMKPGLYRLSQAESFENKLMAAIGLAGGFTKTADLQSIEVHFPDNQKKIINIYDMINNSSITANIHIEDGSTVIVKQGVAQVYVLGQIEKPGGYKYVSGARFTDYIAEAGGPRSTAALDNIGIVRNHIGNTEIFRVQLTDNLQEKNNKNTPEIRPGDMIFIPKHAFADWRDIGTVLGIARDSAIIYNIFKPN